MAVSGAHLTNGNNGSGASGNTASISPGANRLITVAVNVYRGSGALTTPTVTGNGITYTLVDSTTDFASGSDTLAIYLFRGMSASPTTGAISISSANAEFLAWNVDHFDGVDTSGTNGSGAIVQSAKNTGNSTTPNVTLAAFGSANNGAYGAVCTYNSNLHTPGSGWTELGDGADDPQTQWRANNDTTCDWTHPATTDWGAIAIEIKAAGGGGGISGALSQTLGTLTLSSAGTLPIKGALTRTLGAVTLSAQSRLPITGAASRTLGTLTLSASSAGGTSGALAVTLGAMALTAASTATISGSLTQTLAAMVLSAVSAIQIRGSLTQTLGQLLASATNTVASATRNRIVSLRMLIR